MSEYAKINDLETTLVEYMKAKIKSNFPNTDITDNSPLMDMLIYPWATLASQLTTFGTSIESRTNLKNVANLSDKDIDDIGEGNYFIDRGEGSKSFGSCTFSFESISSTQNTLIPEGLPVGTSAGLSFIVTETTSLTPAEMYTKWDAPSLTYKVTVPVESVETGLRYNVAPGDITVIEKTFTDHIVSVVNNASLVSGSDVETNASFLARIKSFYSSRTLETEPGYKQQIMESFPEVTDVAVAGYKDPLMLRDLADSITIDGVTLTNVNIGGKVDIYVKGVNVLSETLTFVAKSELFLFEQLASNINTGTLVVTNMRTMATLSGGNISILPVGEEVYLKINGGFIDGDTIRTVYNYKESGVVFNLTETRTFTIDRPSHRLVLKGPFVACISVVDQTTGSSFDVYDGSPDFDTFMLHPSLDQGLGNGIDADEGSSREEMVFVPAFMFTNGNTISLTYSYIDTIRRIGLFYDAESNRVVTRDVLARKARECYFFIEIEVKLVSGVSGSPSTDGAIFNAVSSFFSSKSMASKIDESDIVNELYQSASTSSIIDYIKMAFKTFHMSTSASEDFVSGIRDGSSIQLGRIEYPSLHTLEIIYL